MEECLTQIQIENHQQKIIDKKLIWGIVFSLFWIWGIGSLVAVVMGFNVRRAIKASNGQYKGSIRAWWCLLVGGIGILWAISVALLSFRYI